MSAPILFLCPHNAAKGVIAAAYFNYLAQLASIPYAADSAGTEPSSEVSPVVVAMMCAEGIDVSGHRPRKVTVDDLSQAATIISMGCTAEELGVSAGRLEMWSDVPMVSEDPDGAREAIRIRVRALIVKLSAGDE